MHLLCGMLLCDTGVSFFAVCLTYVQFHTAYKHVFDIKVNYFRFYLSSMK